MTAPASIAATAIQRLRFESAGVEPKMARTLWSSDHASRDTLQANEPLRRQPVQVSRWAVYRADNRQGQGQVGVERVEAQETPTRAGQSPTEFSKKLLKCSNLGSFLRSKKANPTDDLFRLRFAELGGACWARNGPGSAGARLWGGRLGGGRGCAAVPTGGAALACFGCSAGLRGAG